MTIPFARLRLNKNLSDVPRNYFITLQSQNVLNNPYTFLCTNMNFVGLDWVIVNNDSEGRNAVIKVDGVRYEVVSGAVETHSNEPFNYFSVSGADSVNLRVAGITLPFALQLGVVVAY